MELKGKTGVVTGSNRGIGWALAQEIAKQGCSLILLVRSRDSVSEDQINKLKDLGAPDVKVYELDLSDLSRISETIDPIFAENAPDFLINNAGVLMGGLFEEQTAKQIRSTVDINVTALTLLTRAAIPYFLKRKQGKIINNASVMGEMCFPASHVYAASKAYVIALTRSLRQELKGTGVNTLLMLTPGVKTDMFDDIYKQYSSHFDLDFLSSISAAQWAKRVVKSIKDDDEEVRPSGLTGLGLKMSRYFPRAFQALVATRFHR